MDLDKLLAPRADTPHGMPEDDVEIPNVGTVRVRGMTRAEVFSTQERGSTEVVERAMLAVAMIDPPMTESQARAWQQTSPAGEIEPVTDKIRTLSGLDEGADKAAVSTFRGDTGAGVRAPAGGDAVDDGV